MIKNQIISFLIMMLLSSSIVSGFIINHPSINTMDEQVSMNLTYQQTNVYEKNIQASFESSSLDETYEIYADLPWQLTLSVRWDPPQPEKQICFWANYETLPTGALFPECSCDYGETTGLLEWTPTTAQIGVHQITFFVGETCGEPIGSFTITVIVKPFNQDPTDTFEIHVGDIWQLTITTQWIPPNPERLICLWADPETLPVGATFTECHCDFGSVSSILKWTPQTGQEGEYIIIFYGGDSCGEYQFPFSIRIIVHPVEEDSLPPTSTLSIGEPQYYESYFVTSETPFTLTAVDDADGSGVDTIYYRVWTCFDQQWTEWTKYSSPFNLYGDCFHKVEYYAVDKAGNTENIKVSDHAVDNKVPDTILTPLDPYYYEVDLVEGEEGVTDNCPGSNPAERNRLHAAGGGPLVGAIGGTRKDATDSCCLFENLTISICNNEHDDLCNSIFEGSNLCVDSYAANPRRCWWFHIEENDMEEGECISCTVTNINQRILQVFGEGFDEDQHSVRGRPFSCSRLPNKINEEGHEGKWEIIEDPDTGIIEYKVNASAWGVNDYHGLPLRMFPSCVTISSFSIKPCPHRNDTEDPEKQFCCSGVQSTKYRTKTDDTDWSTWKTFDDPIYFEEENEYDLEYYSIDNVGNMEPVRYQRIVVEYFSAPEKPITPSGPSTGVTSRFIQYETSTTDNDSDLIYYSFDWGDGTFSQWLGPYDSGEVCTASHKWEEEGEYQIRVSAMDNKTCVGTWSDPFPISIPKTRMYHPAFLVNLQKIWNYFEDRNVIIPLFTLHQRLVGEPKEAHSNSLDPLPCNC